MNNTQHEQLFTDLTPTQAETIAAGAALVDAGGSYGFVNADVVRQGPGQGLFYADMYVKDSLSNGYPVYAKFQGLATDGDVLTTSTKLWDRRGAAGDGSSYNNVRVGFNKNIKKLRAVIYQGDPGSDSATSGNWVTL